MKIKIIAVSTTAFVLIVGVLGVQQYISSQITSRVEREIPEASGVSASVPLADLPSNITSDSIKSVNISIKSFVLKENGTKTSLEISASDISKAKPTMAGSLEVTATISASTIAESSEFNDAQIVGNTLQVSAGPGGVGTALLIPKYSNSQLYFELQSISFLGNQIPASSLPAELQDQIKSSSQRSLTPPMGLTVESVSLSSKGLSVKMSGSNIQLGNLGSGL
ncbi:MAG: LmeA family phospholipid-binding protein [Ilumatobacteraceae bacterium]|nr:LmeA family phospholipid-binding protein [Ilumatobacteraceae bacterium]